MRCQWQSFINLLPVWLRDPVDRLGKPDLTELHLRIGLPPHLVFTSKSLTLERTVTQEDIDFCLNIASDYSPWVAETSQSCYLTATGGHRIGLCGLMTKSGTVFSSVTSVCIRIAKDIPAVSGKLGLLNDSILIIGPPGSGKTTLLRDLIRCRSDAGLGTVAVVDERCELFPLIHKQYAFPTGKQTDILQGCTKGKGIINMIRCMSPCTIAVDEITSPEDCEALVHAAWCGVKLLATAHASCKADLQNRQIYKPLLDNGLFDRLVILQKDKHWIQERMIS